MGLKKYILLSYKTNYYAAFAKKQLIFKLTFFSILLSVQNLKLLFFVFKIILLGDSSHSRRSANWIFLLVIND
jgi:hypothetical protein